MKKLLILFLLLASIISAQSQFDSRILFCANGKQMEVVAGFWDCADEGNATGTCSAGQAVVQLTASGMVCDPNVAFDDEQNLFTATQAMDDQNMLQFQEANINGNNFKAFQAPGVITTDTTCTFENDANFIPDSCVGDGVDDDGGWNDAGTEINLNTSTDEVEIGSSATLAGKLAVNGDADEVQLYIQGNATQTNNNVLVEQSGGTDIFRVSNTGTLIGGANAATILNVLTGTATIDFADPGQNNCTAASNVTVTGATAGDACFIGTTASAVDIWYECQITAANTCAIRACKVGNVAEDPASVTFRCVVMDF